MTLILHPTQEALWHNLVFDAEKELSFQLSEELESYLVFLLIRFSKNPNLLSSILATDYLLTPSMSERERDLNLRDIGDKCLLFSGFFPGKARKSRVRISYYVKLGKQAYITLSELKDSSTSSLFLHLCQYFVPMMDVLQTIREHNKEHPLLDLLQAEELWQDTQSPHALKILRQYTKGFILSSPYNNSSQRH